ncbi:hypothetical protein E6O75_ATG01676 [Venturia nashicola]|uniref:Uncharacterized protein n=1 Tax=Venturia nashicola TaxID=86259 RepID=A0A4Z1P1W9_9PEZI|nr:hypothetical protein E6O75_ATG01676 [Venturia nashicola]
MISPVSSIQPTSFTSSSLTTLSSESGKKSMTESIIDIVDHELNHRDTPLSPRDERQREDLWIFRKYSGFRLCQYQSF